MNRLTKYSLIGAVITAICCFTPLLVWILAGLGLTSAIAYLDPVLLPLLGIFIALTLWGFVQSRKAG